MRYRKRKCRCCRKWFMPDPRNAWRQKFCSARACRKASHNFSHRKWLRKHPDAYCGIENVTRTRNWRADHRGYWRRSTPIINVIVRLRVRLARKKHLIYATAAVPLLGVLQDFACVERNIFQRITLKLGIALPDYIKISRAA